MRTGRYTPEITSTSTATELMLRLKSIDHRELWAPSPPPDSIEDVGYYIMVPLEDVGYYIMAPVTGEGGDEESHVYAAASDSEPEPEEEFMGTTMPLPFLESDVEDDDDGAEDDASGANDGEPVCMPAAKGKKKEQDFPGMPRLDPKEKPSDFHSHNPP